MKSTVQCIHCHLTQFEGPACRRCRKELPIVKKTPLTLLQAERLALEIAVDSGARSQDELARRLGCHRHTLTRMLLRHGLAVRYVSTERPRPKR